MNSKKNTKLKATTTETTGRTNEQTKLKVTASPVFGTNGGMGAECKLFLKNLAEKLSRKTGNRTP